jgi:hypothetical protein
MKLAIRIFALSIVVAGVAAASTATRPATSVASLQSASNHFPYPTCCKVK